MTKRQDSEAPSSGRRSGTRARLPVVLVAEDFVEGRAIHVEFFSREGFAIVEAGDANDVMRLAAGVRPDIVVLDLALPGARGVDVVHALRASERASDAPIVALAGPGDDAVAEEARSAGCAAILRKPVGLQQLRREVMLALARARGAGQASTR
jgi:two-component system phosphate regulon response regulator PhoB